MTRRFLTILGTLAVLVMWSGTTWSQDEADEADKEAQPSEGGAEAKPEESKPEETPAEAAPGESTEEPIGTATGEPADTGGETTDPEPEVSWPYQQPLFALYAKPQTRVRVGVGFATNPDVDSLAFFVEGAFAFLDDRLAARVRMPLGYAMHDVMDDAFTFGDLELGVMWLITHDEESQKHLTVGLDFIMPTSRGGEEKDLAGLRDGVIGDDSNFGKRYLLAQKPMLDMGLVPKLNVGLVPHVSFGQNIGRVSLQTNFGCMILVMDNVDETIYGTDRRLGFILFYDLAAPVAITKELSIVSEFNAAVALDGLLGTGFALTVGPRYTTGSFSAGLGVQIPIGVDNDPPDDDKMVGRYDAAIIARHHVAAILDLSYNF